MAKPDLTPDAGSYSASSGYTPKPYASRPASAPEPVTGKPANSPVPKAKAAPSEPAATPAAATDSKGCLGAMIFIVVGILAVLGLLAALPWLLTSLGDVISGAAFRDHWSAKASPTPASLIGPIAVAWAVTSTVIFLILSLFKVSTGKKIGFSFFLAPAILIWILWPKRSYTGSYIDSDGAIIDNYDYT